MPYAIFFFITYLYAGYVQIWSFFFLFTQYEGIPQRLLLSFGLSTNAKTILSTKELPQVILNYELFEGKWVQFTT